MKTDKRTIRSRLTRKRGPGLRAARGYAAPLCPRCTRQKWDADMKRDISTLNWHCQKCGTTWNSSYLDGWNDGHAAAQHNEKGQATQPNV